MKWIIFVVGCALICRGSFLIPSTLSEAKSALAPYRGLRGALYLVYGVFVTALSGVSP